MGTRAEVARRLAAGRYGTLAYAKGWQGAGGWIVVAVFPGGLPGMVRSGAGWPPWGYHGDQLRVLRAGDPF